MRNKKKLKLFVPNLKQLEESIKNNPPNFNYKIKYFYIIIDTIIRSQAYNRKQKYVNINMKKLTSYTCYNINLYVKYLKDNKLIFCDNKIYTGKSYGYKIDCYDYNFVEIESEVKYSKSLKNKKTNYCKQDDFIKKMRYEFNNIKFDFEAALECNSKQPDNYKKLYSYIHIENLKDKSKHFFDRNKTNNRLDSNLTTLNSNLKKFIIGDYVKIDLKNSQPFFLNTLVNFINNINNINIYNNNNNNNIPLYNRFLKYDIYKTFGKRAINNILKFRNNPNFKKNTNFINYKNWTTNGIFYEKFLEKTNKNISRKKIKNICFKILFSKNKYKNGTIPYKKEKEIFKSVFPYVYHIIKSLKDKDYKKLSIFLQKIESYIFIDCIAKQLVDNNIIPFTIHDEIIVPTKDKELTLEIIKSVFFDKFNVIPAFKIAPLNNTKTIINNNKLCPITKLDISMQKPDSKYLNAIGIKHYYFYRPFIFKNLKKRFSNNCKNENLNTQINEIALSIKNQYLNKNNDTKQNINKILSKPILFYNLLYIDEQIKNNLKKYKENELYILKNDISKKNKKSSKISTDTVKILNVSDKK